MPPRRPDPETGLLPEQEPMMVSHSPQGYPIMPQAAYAMSFSDDASEMASPAASPQTTRRTRSLSEIADRLMMERLVTPTEVPMATQITVERDFARSGVNLHIRQVGGNRYEERYNVIADITWRALTPGEDVRANPFWIDERGARQLAEQLGDFNPQIRRAQETSRMHDEARSELRSVANQLQEVQAHNETLIRVNEEQQRQIRWLERELRDANQERRTITPTHS
jgi:hypothetical protein